MNNAGPGSTQFVDRLYEFPLCVRNTVQNLPWRLPPRPVSQSLRSGMQILCEDVWRAADRLEPLQVAYVQADDPAVPWTTYTPLNQARGTFRWQQRDWSVLSQIFACDSPVWLIFFSRGVAHDALSFYEEFCMQAIRWELQAFPPPAGWGQLSPILAWTLGLFDLAWNHPSLRARPMYSSAIATAPVIDIEHSVKNELPNPLQMFFADVPLPLPGFFRVLQPDCFRSSAWRIRRVLECCAAPLDQPRVATGTPPQDFITQTEAAKLAECDESTIMRWFDVENGLTAHGPKGRRRVSKAELLEKLPYLRQRGRRSVPRVPSAKPA
ncbi:MAG: hypothetical protein AMXMBFR58_11490 [Phycisphaerae bacterium]